MTALVVARRMTEPATHDERSAAIDTHGRLNLAMWTIDWTARTRSRESRELPSARCPGSYPQASRVALTDNHGENMIQLNIHAKSASALRNELASILAQPAPLAPLPPSGLILPAAFGAELQGGIYAGPHFEDGKLVHLIAAPESIGEHQWEAGKTAAAEYRGAGFGGWFMPEKSHLMIAQIYIKDRFEKAYHWSATPYGGGGAWRVSFEDGYVYITNRIHEFRVRPFRRLSI